jgi:tRNA (cmo5U34)-methyltransferase
MGKDKVLDVNRWRSADHVKKYLSIADNRPHGEEIMQALLEQIPSKVNRVLDLGTGDGRLLAMVLQRNPDAKGVGLDFSEPMLMRARRRFRDNESVEILKHDLNDKLPVGRWEPFDLVISGLAIHHLDNERKNELYGEVFAVLRSGGVFVNLDHVSSPTSSLHRKFLEAVGLTPEMDDPSNKLLDVHTQVAWLKEIGFKDADCFYKWLEVTIMGGTKP